MLPAEEPSALSRRGALVGFPGLPIWILAGSLGYVAWLIAAATSAGHPDWSRGVWAWLVVAYALQVVGITFGLLLPRCAAAKTGRRYVPAASVWLSAYSWPVGIVGVAVLLAFVDDEPRAVTLWAVVATAYCFAVAMADLSTFNRLAQRGGDAQGRRGRRGR